MLIRLISHRDLNSDIPIHHHRSIRSDGAAASIRIDRSLGPIGECDLVRTGIIGSRHIVIAELTAFHFSARLTYLKMRSLAIDERRAGAAEVESIRLSGCDLRADGLSGRNDRRIQGLLAAGAKE